MIVLDGQIGPDWCPSCGGAEMVPAADCYDVAMNDVPWLLARVEQMAGAVRKRIEWGHSDGCVWSADGCTCGYDDQRAALAALEESE